MRRILFLIGGIAIGIAMFVAFYQETFVKPSYPYIGDSGAESDTLLVNCTEYEARHAVGPHDGLSWHLARVGYRETHEGCEAILLDHDLAKHYGHLPMAEQIPAPEGGPDTWGVRAWAADGHTWRRRADIPDSLRARARQVWKYRWSERTGID